MVLNGDNLYGSVDLKKKKIYMAGMYLGDWPLRYKIIDVIPQKPYDLYVVRQLGIIGWIKYIWEGK